MKRSGLMGMTNKHGIKGNFIGVMTMLCIINDRYLPGEQEWIFNEY